MYLELSFDIEKTPKSVKVFFELEKNNSPILSDIHQDKSDKYIILDLQ
jgi:hypothetical protein